MTDTLDRLREAAARYDDGGGEGEALAQAALAQARRLAKSGGKWCPGCKTTRGMGEFGRHSGRSDGKQIKCRACRASK